MNDLESEIANLESELGRVQDELYKADLRGDSEEVYALKTAECELEDELEDLYQILEDE